MSVLWLGGLEQEEDQEVSPFRVFLLAFGTSSLYTPHKFLSRNGHRLSVLLHLALFTFFFSIPSSRVSGG